MQLLFTISVAILLTGSEASSCTRLNDNHPMNGASLAQDVQTCGANSNEQCPYAPYPERQKLRCTVKDDLTKAMFFDSNGCDVLRGHILCSSSAGNDAANNNKCVQYTHDGRNCPQDRTHAIPLCGQLDNIAGLTDLEKASKQKWDATANNGQGGWVNNPLYGTAGNTHPAQGLVGFHFCQRSIKCYHPQAFSVASIVASVNVGTTDAYQNKRLPTPDESGGITARCDDYAGKASEEHDSTADNKGNWRDHIFEAANSDYVTGGIDADCEKDWWNDQPKTKPRACTPTETSSNKHCATQSCTGDETKAGKTVCSDPNPDYSAACVIHQLPSSNSYSKNAQCAHGVVPVDNCNGITFYFFIEKRGHNYKFNFCRHSGALDTPKTAKNNYGTDQTGWGAAAKAGQNQWKKR